MNEPARYLSLSQSFRLYKSGMKAADGTLFMIDEINLVFVSKVFEASVRFKQHMLTSLALAPQRALSISKTIRSILTSPAISSPVPSYSHFGEVFVLLLSSRLLLFPTAESAGFHSSLFTSEESLNVCIVALPPSNLCLSAIVFDHRSSVSSLLLLLSTFFLLPTLFVVYAYTFVGVCVCVLMYHAKYFLLGLSAYGWSVCVYYVRVGAWIKIGFCSEMW